MTFALWLELFREDGWKLKISEEINFLWTDKSQNWDLSVCTTGRPIEDFLLIET